MLFDDPINKDPEAIDMLPLCLTVFLFTVSHRGSISVGSGLLVSFMFKAGKEHPKECRETRIDIDRRLQKALREW